MKPTDRNARRRPRAPLAAEPLESRSLLTGGMGNTFAILPGTIAQAGGTAQVQVTLAPSLFTMPHNHIELGIDVVAASGSTVQPMVAGVVGSNGPSAKTLHLQRSRGSYAVIIDTGQLHAAPGQTVTLTVALAAAKGTSGDYLLGFYLPGDVNGNGVVDSTDIQSIKGAMRSKNGDPGYNFSADNNRDGRINADDLTIARKNLGAATLVNPLISANLTPPAGASAATTTSRILTTPQAQFTGTATPGATLAFAGNGQTYTATADAAGNYAITVPLVPGSDTFHVTTADAFGQAISGNLTPVVYLPQK
ncbi:MAG TPA: dockerin type I domain-containing protein [Isosphaeraceae bacterium]|jgi:hypothetical protein|nr:dockerin type I domain-containing protein [Isosphaeraceae bacterium]